MSPHQVVPGNVVIEVLLLTVEYVTDSTMTPLEKKNIDSLTVVELKEELRSRGSPVIGRKKDLLERLKSVLAEGNEERSGQDAGGAPPPLPPQA